VGIQAKLPGYIKDRKIIGTYYFFKRNEAGLLFVDQYHGSVKCSSGSKQRYLEFVEGHNAELNGSRIDVYLANRNTT
jgi:hypothetical protein